MRRAARIDANQAAIVEALRRAGASVQPIAAMGRGVPDLLIGYRGRNYLLEVKDGGKRPSARRLTKDESGWHEAWGGQVAIAETVEAALALIGRDPNEATEDEDSDQAAAENRPGGEGRRVDDLGGERRGREGEIDARPD